MIRIVVDGPPVGKGRPRFVRSIGRAFTPAKTANYEAILAARGADAMGRRPPLEGPLQVVVTAFMPLAKSWPPKKTAAALEGRIRPGKPDADNILKVLDALNGIVWRDDSQIAEARISKLYDPDPRLEIEVSALEIEVSALGAVPGTDDLEATIRSAQAQPGLFNLERAMGLRP